MVAQLGLGTAELGEYAGRPAPDFEKAVELVLYALHRGIRWIDTAPAYGQAERAIGEAIRRFGGKPPQVLTKCGAPRGIWTVATALVQAQRSALRSMWPLASLQLHNAAAPDMRRDAPRWLAASVRRCGLAATVGATVYELDAALEAVRCPWVGTVQVPYSVLDQRFDLMLREAKKRGALTIARSVLLRGRTLAHEGVREVAEDWEMTPVELCLRFVLGHDAAQVVLVGARSMGEIDDATAAAKAGPLPPDVHRRALGLATNDLGMIDPRRWQ